MSKVPLHRAAAPSKVGPQAFATSLIQLALRGSQQLEAEIEHSSTNTYGRWQWGRASTVSEGMARQVVENDIQWNKLMNELVKRGVVTNVAIEQNLCELLRERIEEINATKALAARRVSTASKPSSKTIRTRLSDEAVSARNQDWQTSSSRQEGIGRDLDRKDLLDALDVALNLDL